MDAKRAAAEREVHDPDDLAGHLGGIGLSGLEAGQAFQRLIRDARIGRLHSPPHGAFRRLAGMGEVGWCLW